MIVALAILSIWFASAYAILILVEPHDHVNRSWIDVAFVMGPFFLILCGAVFAYDAATRVAKMMQIRIKRWTSP